MKRKILIILTIVTLLIGVMAIPSFALDTGEDITDLTGTTWFVDSGWTIPGGVGKFNFDVSLTTSSNPNVVYPVEMWFGYTISGWSNDRIAVVTDNSDSYGGYSILPSSSFTITFIGGDGVTDTKLISWLSTYGELLPKCDGSSCPATDVNLDNICDDCGMTFSMLRDFTPSDFPSGYPSVPSVASDARYYLYRVHSSVHTYIVVYPSTVTPTYDTTKQNGYLTFSESYGSYRLDTANNEWVLNNDDSPYSIGGTNNNSVDILYSSVPIKDENGENFFPIPLWEKVEKVTQGEIPTFNNQVVGNLMTVTLCGVGLITLLVVLYLLSKTFRRFLP